MVILKHLYPNYVHIYALNQANGENMWLVIYTHIADLVSIVYGPCLHTSSNLEDI